MYKKFDPKFGSHILTIFAGEMYVSKKGEILSTILGSCISVCLYDIEKNIGGMNHFMLPDNSGGLKGWDGVKPEIKKEDLTEKSMRYGITAMELLIGEMQKNGAERKSLRAKIFGGGNIINRNLSKKNSVGDKNIGFARAYLKMEGIKIESENVGAQYGRKIFYLTEKNKIFVKKVALEPALEEEKKYMKLLLDIKKESDITVF